jgi:hypothetical protein
VGLKSQKSHNLTNGYPNNKKNNNKNNKNKVKSKPLELGSRVKSILFHLGHKLNPNGMSSIGGLGRFLKTA